MSDSDNSGSERTYVNFRIDVSKKEAWQQYNKENKVSPTLSGFIRQSVNARLNDTPMGDYDPDDGSRASVDPSEVTVDVDHSAVIEAVEALGERMDDVTDRLERIERQDDDETDMSGLQNQCLDALPRNEPGSRPHKEASRIGVGQWKHQGNDTKVLSNGIEVVPKRMDAGSGTVADVADFIDADRGDVRMALERLHEMNAVGRKSTDDGPVFWKLGDL